MNPTVNIVYDGAAKLRSCQPNIRSLVEAIGDLPEPGEELVANLHGDAAAKIVKAVKEAS